MSAPTLAALESALAEDALGDWLATIPILEARQRIRRAIELDRRLSREHPASLASCLLARLFGDATLAPLCSAWAAELDARGVPWIRPLRGLPIREGLLAELHGSADLPLAGLQCLSFLSDDEVTLTAIRFHPSVQPPEQRRRDRLRWRWTTGEALLEPDTDADAESTARWPKFEHPGWGPLYMTRRPGDSPIALPCPDGGSASAKLTTDGRLIVYGTHEDYQGGFVYILDPATLAVLRRLETERPVSDVCTCARDDLLLVSTYHDALAWAGDDAFPLPVPLRKALLSPSGGVVATLGEGLRIWSLPALMRGGAAPGPGFRACFDPSGGRLATGDRLYDAHTGAEIATLDPRFGEYLEGGPAEPATYFGTRHLIHLHGRRQAWDTRTGAAVPVSRFPFYPHWFVLAHDRAGERVAALKTGQHEVALHAIPQGEEVRRLRFELAGEALALAPDASLLAVQQGAAVEVRHIGTETLVRRLGGAPASSRPSWDTEETLHFSGDGRRLACFSPGDGWRIWTLDGTDEEHIPAREGLDACPDFAPPRPRGWSIIEGSQTLFVHTATGTTIALPAAGPWVCSPADPQIVASDALHAELRAPERSGS